MPPVSRTWFFALAVVAGGCSHTAEKSSATDLSAQQPDGATIVHAGDLGSDDLGDDDLGNLDMPTKASKPFFYGINGHPDYTFGAQDWVTGVNAIGAKLIRLDTWGYDTTKVPHIADLANGIRALDTTIKILPVIMFSFDTTTNPTEAANYAATYTGSTYVAQTLGAAGITDYECGNELLTDSRVWPNSGASGMTAADFTGSGTDGAWACLRGALRGCIDAVHSVNPAYRAGINFTVAQIAASDMMWTGAEPDGSTGYPTVKWDITTWHNYRPYGDPFHMGSNNFNLMQYIATAYGKPIMVTEWNNDTSDDGAAAWMQMIMQESYDNRVALNIETIMFYQLEGGIPDYGLYAYPDKAATYTAFTAANPNP